MKLTLNETAAKFDVAPAVIDDYIKNGLVPSRAQTADDIAFDETDMYWVEMAHCFIENGSSVEDVKELIKRCKI
ncbi:hypothetical protein FAM21834_01658 [Lentilactobacillus parabuchneri]|jgi:DNA-binding transcriptional MerR regulator|uniref:HTH merR-type domain-containing protein n=2 Tax=Lentilactobacillus parabuchneri TaxID=152331 RepID=A0A1X1FE10_9LACO|nr:MerR family transcriptional regulator [Lentilactobacillus parabuchneri]APR07842.1 hypothetical protein FAM21731_01669 [Lentilactobacillus parabuchneri]KRM47084.1 hypothetical protein FC51_GL001518 [Lentilactobacillus parabuchneri DSM 5707 = NBRC 107865]KRN70845.1 hypothetical protein IV42_GL001742 [Lentilactobacillus parabuchneri]MBW0222188.1 MerR family transcriptional regulator [Lentilactobacillus parabuchneri]MBW0245575.1 MerR family transcriptional regulator [Lentilactobacillus parabuch